MYLFWELGVRPPKKDKAKQKTTTTKQLPMHVKKDINALLGHACPHQNCQNYGDS